MPPVTLAAGSLRHQVQIQKRATSQDAVGGELEAWSTIRSCWAAIAIAKSPMATEKFQANQFVGQTTHTITVRYLASPEITPGMRVVFGSHTYLIQSVPNTDMRDVRIDMMCLEIDGSQ